MLYSCAGTDELIVKPAQITTLLEEYPTHIADELAITDKDLTFWKSKLAQNPTGFLYAEKISSALDERFRLKGDIEDIDSSNHYLQQAIGLRNGWKTNDIYQNQISNLIKLHRFQDAERLCIERLNEQPRNLGFQLQFFDVLMELGKYEDAQRLLVRISKSNHGFDVIIRQAKLFDYLGRLDRTLELMAKADSMAMKSTNPSLQAWTKTIYGEYLTHSGAIEEAFHQFSLALQLDPTQEYAWLNIAWIAYSHDNNPVLYERILSTLNVKSTPDLLWELAQLYKDQGDQRYHRRIKDFYDIARQPKYQLWYGPKLIELEGEHLGNHLKACQMAWQEVENRPTLEAYDGLSWSLFQAGKFDSAKMIFENHLFRKTTEPLIQYHGSEIYLKTKDIEKAKRLLAEASEARFELGPSIFKRIDQLSIQIP